MWTWLKTSFHKLGSPKHFWKISEWLLPILTVLTILAFAIGIPWGLIYSPVDDEMGHSVRIMYIHVPAASLSLMVYAVMAVCGAVYLVWHMKMAELVAYASASIGAWFTFLALTTGALWGKPDWGHWWTWDPRLTFELVLLFIYLGYIALYNAIEDRRQAAKAVALLSLVTVAIVPLIKYAINIWKDQTAHQGSSDLDPQFLGPFFTMMFGYLLFYGMAVTKKVRASILESEHKSAWVKELVKQK